VSGRRDQLELFSAEPDRFRDLDLARARRITEAERHADLAAAAPRPTCECDRPLVLPAEDGPACWKCGRGAR
jgi:hypothetical protein